MILISGTGISLMLLHVSGKMTRRRATCAMIHFYNIPDNASRPSDNNIVMDRIKTIPAFLAIRRVHGPVALRQIE
ncbi:hypothetical protein GGS26DRAFT_372732 [Hypomontagnella submonticulosa]|nr:hypothetical protein GGS26DRAFT_372732 [Hypomontagnella submonticulosa]